MKRFCSVPFMFLGIFALNLIGAIYFYLSTGSNLYRLILVSLLGFLIGCGLCTWIKSKKWIWNGGRKHVAHTARRLGENTGIPEIDYCVIWVLFIMVLVFGFSLFVQRGIPLFHANDNALRSAFGVGTKGRIRAIVVWIPMAALSMYLLHIKTGKYKLSAYFMIAAALCNLMFYSYKSEILWLFILLFYVNYYMKKQLEFKKMLLYLSAAFGLMLLVFSIWLSANSGTAVAYLLKRMTADQVDGLNYVFNTYVNEFGFEKGQHFVEEFQNVFMSVSTGQSFDLKLAELFYGNKVTWGIVLTLYGFFFIDFGYSWTFIGFTVLGICVGNVHKYLQRGAALPISSMVSGFFLITLLSKIFLVGNVFNELKGVFVSIIFFKFLYDSCYAFFAASNRLNLESYVSAKRSVNAL